MLVPDGRTTDPFIRLTYSPHREREPQPRTGGSAAKAPLEDGGEDSVDLVVAWAGGLADQGSSQLQERHVTILFPSRSQAAARRLVSCWKIKFACLTFLMKFNCSF